MGTVITLPKNILLIPYVCGAGASRLGSERGPIEIQRRMQSELGSAWANAVWDRDPEALYKDEVKLYSTMPPLDSKVRREFVLKHCRDIRDRVENAVKLGVMPVTIGGDHSMAAGTIAGLARAKNANGKIGLIWIDAHSDINTEESSKTHALHGMPVASLLGRGERDFATLGGEMAVINPENLVYIGLRDVEDQEETVLGSLPIKKYRMKDINLNNLDRIFDEALEHAMKGMDYLVLSIDLDAFDPTEAPAVGSPVAGGLTKNAVLHALAKLVAKRSPDLVEIVEFNPLLGDSEITYALVKDILSTTLNVHELEPAHR